MPSGVSGTQQEFSKQFKVEATALKKSFSNLDDFQQNQREAVNFLMINQEVLCQYDIKVELFFFLFPSDGYTCVPAVPLPLLGQSCE